jgi:hypothetical protein
VFKHCLNIIWTLFATELNCWGSDFFYITNMANNQFNPPVKKPFSQEQPKLLSEQAAKKVANVLHVMLNDKKR